MTRDQYQRGVAEVRGELVRQPGFHYHLAGPIANGWQVTEVWDSQDQVNNWVQNTIMPMAQRVGFADGMQPPEIEELDNYFGK